MRKSFLLSSAVVLLLSGGMAGVAQAAPTPTCGTATAAVTSAETDVRNETRDVSNAQEALDEAQAQRDAANSALQTGLLTDPPLGAAVLQGLRDALFVEENQLDDAQEALDAEKAQLAAAQTRLANAIDARDSACAPKAPEDDLDCDDFASQVAAQTKLNEDLAYPHNLDSDGDGQACEDFFAVPVTTTTTPPPATVAGDDVIGEDNDQTVNINIPGDNDSGDGVNYRPRTSGGIATG